MHRCSFFRQKNINNERHNIKIEFKYHLIKKGYKNKKRLYKNMIGFKLRQNISRCNKQVCYTSSTTDNIQVTLSNL